MSNNYYEKVTIGGGVPSIRLDLAPEILCMYYTLYIVLAICIIPRFQTRNILPGLVRLTTSKCGYEDMSCQPRTRLIQTAVNEVLSLVMPSN